MLDAPGAAARVADLIERRGITVNLSSGGSAKCILDDSADRVTRYTPENLMDRLTGTLAVFDFEPSAAVKAGDMVTDPDGMKWTLHPAKRFRSEGSATLVRLTFIGASGAVR